MTRIINLLTIDVEDWFHILDLDDGVSPEQYDSMPSMVVENTMKVLRLLEKHCVLGTFFIVGWVAERFPELVKEIHRRGHEVASHSYYHTLSDGMDSASFRDDVTRSVAVLENLTGEKVLGFRSPGMSVKQQNLWALDILLELGLKYDSSIYPGTSGHGGLDTASKYPYWQDTPAGGKIYEIPSSCFTFMGKNIGFAGGGYLRLFPYALIHCCMKAYNDASQPVNVYFHPREIDPDHPRLPMPLKRRFKSYVNLSSGSVKLDRLLCEFSFGRIKDIFSFI